MPLIYNTEVSSDLGSRALPRCVDNGMAGLLAQQLPAEIILSLYPTANAIFSSLSDKQNCIQMLCTDHEDYYYFMLTGGHVTRKDE